MYMYSLIVLGVSVYLTFIAAASPVVEFSRLFTCAGPHCIDCNRTGAKAKTYSDAVGALRSTVHFCDLHSPPEYVGWHASSSFLRNFLRLLFGICMLTGLVANPILAVKYGMANHPGALVMLIGVGFLYLLSVFLC